MKEKDIVYDYLTKHYKDVSMDNIITEIPNNMYSYTDKKNNKHIIRIISINKYTFERENLKRETKLIKYNDKYALELVTVRNRDNN